MSLYGDSYINVNALKRWVNTLSLDAVRSVDVGGNTITIDGPVKEILELQLEGFSDFIYQLPDDGDWREFQGALSRLFYNAFFRVDNNAIRIANYYECLLVPSNMKTYKKIIRGYDYVDIGAIHITDINGNYIASIGQKSDLLWSTFFDYFMNEDEEGIHHVYSNHEQYLSIQLFDTESMTQEEITIFVNEILLSISSKYDMDFKIFELDPKYRELGNNTIYNMVYSPVGFEQMQVSFAYHISIILPILHSDSVYIHYTLYAIAGVPGKCHRSATKVPRSKALLTSRMQLYGTPQNRCQLTGFQVMPFGITIDIIGHIVTILRV